MNVVAAQGSGIDACKKKCVRTKFPGKGRSREGDVTTYWEFPSDEIDRVQRWPIEKIGNLLKNSNLLKIEL